MTEQTLNNIYIAVCDGKYDHLKLEYQAVASVAIRMINESNFEKLPAYSESRIAHQIKDLVNESYLRKCEIGPSTCLALATIFKWCERKPSYRDCIHHLAINLDKYYPNELQNLKPPTRRVINIYLGDLITIALLYIVCRYLLHHIKVTWI